MKSQIKKLEVTVAPRLLKAHWTPNYDDLEQSIADKIGEEMRQHIDWGILSKLIDTTNWIEVTYDSNDYNDVNVWLKENIKRGYFTFYTHVMFADESKANWFKLTWI